MQNKKSKQSLVISGLGIVSPIGGTRESFLEALLQGKSQFSTLQREGRGNGKFVGSELQNFTPPGFLQQHQIRGASFSSQVTLDAIAHC